MQDWQTPFGVVPTDHDAISWLQHHHHIPINEAVHAKEHSIENQLPFLQQGADTGWDPLGWEGAGLALGATSRSPAAAAGAAGADLEFTREVRGARADAHRAATAAGRAGAGPPGQGAERKAAELRIVPISVGYLGDDLSVVEAYGRAVAELLQYLEARSSNTARYGEQLSAANKEGTDVLTKEGASGPSVVASGPPPAAPGGCGREGKRELDHTTTTTSSRSRSRQVLPQQQQPRSVGGGSEVKECVVLIATSDLTHAGPWYDELPPAGVSLGEYMRSQDMPVIQVRSLVCWIV